MIKEKLFNFSCSSRNGEGRHAGEREAADDEAAERERQRLAEARHPVERLVARHRADDRARRHEQQRLEEGVRHQVEEAGGVGAGRDAHDHVADLRHRRVCDHSLDVGLHQRDRAGDEERRAADDRADVGGRLRVLEERVHAGDEVDAGGHHRGGVDQGGDRRRALHRVRQPGVERDLRGLRERADQQQDAAGDERAVVRVERARVDLGERAEEVERAAVAQDEEGPEHEADVAEHVDDEGLDAGARRRPAPVPEGDQQVRGGADEPPADDQDEEVRRQDQQQHREDEEVEVCEVARVASVALHVADRVEVDQRRDPRDHEDHVDRQRVDEDRQLRVDAGRDGVVPQRGDELAVRRGVALQRDQRRDRRGERERDHQRADRAGRAAREASVAQPDDGRPRQREGENEPAERGRHPCSSLSSSTSIGSLRR